MNKPLIIYVSGAPGSGKTTLARILADQLYVPSISSDTIHGGVAFLHPEHDRKQTLVNVFVPTMIGLAQNSVSFVADQVLQKGVSEATIIDRLRPYAQIINIHTVCSDPIARYMQRVQSSEVPSVIARREQLLERAAYHKGNLDKTSQPLDLGVPTLVVNTDEGYTPNLSQVLNFIKKNYPT
ncbi:MAG TPA: AAA family ATPase [Candidatus Saccharimonadales bacterium]